MALFDGEVDSVSSFVHATIIANGLVQSMREHITRLVQLPSRGTLHDESYAWPAQFDRQAGHFVARHR